MRRRFKRDTTAWVEHELRHHRPEPGDDFVRELTGRVSADTSRRTTRGLRIAFASTGKPQRVALAEAARLNPLSPEVAQFRRSLDRSGRKG